MLFYFTGTGNCLYVAKQIEKDPISIAQIIHHSDLSFKDEKIGIVAPVYGHEVPEMVKDFMRKAQFETDYFYMILTYGNRHGGASELASQLCTACRITPQYINVLKMVDNFLPGFDMDEQRKMDKQEDFYISQIIADIEAKKVMISEVTEQDRQAHRNYLERQAKLPSGIFKNLYHVTDACIGCGICTKVCPAGCISLENGRPVYQTDQCQMCMACIHHCPQKAIQLNMPEKNPQARYRHPAISLKEIMDANHQEK